jgi:hypothetical protein
MAKTIKAVVNTGNPQTNELLDIVVGSGAQGKPTRVKAVQGARYVLQDPAAKDVAPEKVRTKRVGKDLHVAFEDGAEADLIVENYYNVNATADGGSGLFGRTTTDGGLHQYVAEDATSAASVSQLKDGGVAVSQVLASDESGEAFALTALPVVAAAGVSPLSMAGGLLAAAALGGAGGAGGSGVAVVAAVPAKPTAPIVIETVATKQNILTSGDATSDTKPAITGTGTAGNLIKLYDGNELIASTTVSENGTWSIKPSAELSNGIHNWSVTETNTSGESAKSTVSSIVVDTVLPNDGVAPTVLIITDADNNGYVNGVELNKGGAKYIAQVSFDASKVSVGDKAIVSDGSTTRTVVLTDADLSSGFVSVAFNAPSEGDTLTITAQLKDAANNTSLVGTDSARLDTIAPNGGAAPVVEIITDVNNDGMVNFTELAGKLTFTVKASFDKTTVLAGEKVVFDTGLR